jgi:raffinose/stachyose/melibiose transport system substrate-binding protein
MILGNLLIPINYINYLSKGGNMMKRNFLFILLTLVLVVSSLVGCSAKETSENGSNTVSIWSWRDQDKELWEKVQQKLNDEGKDITIEFRSVAATEYDASLQTAMNAGEGPDILTIRAGAGTVKYAEPGLVAALDDKVSGIKDFSEGTLSQVGFDGKTYSVPFAVQTSQFFYNKEIFEKYNLSEPNTWDDLVVIMKTLKDNGVTPMSVSGREGWALNLIVDSVGATHLGDEWVSGLIDGKHKFNDPEFVDVLTKVDDLQQYFQDGFMAAGYQDMQTSFAQGQTAIIMDGIWGVKAILEQNPDLKMGSFMSPPENEGDPEGIYAFVDGGYALNAASENQDNAVEVLKFAATKEFGQLYTDTFGEISAFPGIKPTNPTEMLSQAMDRFENNSINQLFRIRSPFDSGELAIGTILASGMQELLGDKKSPQELGDSLQKDISSWYPAFTK